MVLGQFENVSTGETSQAIAPFHFFDYFTSLAFYHKIDIYGASTFRVKFHHSRDDFSSSW